MRGLRVHISQAKVDQNISVFQYFNVVYFFPLWQLSLISRLIHLTSNSLSQCKSLINSAPQEIICQVIVFYPTSLLRSIQQIKRFEFKASASSMRNTIGIHRLFPPSFVAQFYSHQALHIWIRYSDINWAKLNTSTNVRAGKN